MRRIALLLALISFAVACKKDQGDPNNQTSSEAFIRFKANGKSITFGALGSQPYGGVSAVKLTMSPVVRELAIRGIESGPDEITIAFVIDSVKAGETYKMQEPGVGLFRTYLSEKLYLINQFSGNSRDSVDVTIDIHSGGWISGRFVGKVSHVDINGSRTEVVITEGAFRSKVRYE